MSIKTFNQGIRKIKMSAETKNLKVVHEVPAAAAAAVAAKVAVEESQNSILTVSFEALRLDNQDYETSAGVKIITSVLVSKPNKQSFIRVHPGPEWRLLTGILEIKEDRETFMIAPELRAELAAETVRVELYSAITRQGTFFLWPVKVPGVDGRSNLWHESAVAAAQEAMTKWVRVGANMQARAYEVMQAVEQIPEPVWPTSKSFEELVRLAFKDRYIASMDHPVVRGLRGRL
jgi:hypothetical protein